MSTDAVPWEPPLAGTEAEQLAGALERLRATFRWKADDLDAVGLGTPLATSTLTLGGLLKHLAAMEDYTFTHKLSGAPMGEPWDAMGWDGDNDWEFESAAEDPPDRLYGSGTEPWRDPARASPRPSPMGMSTSWSMPRCRTAATPACAACCAT